METAITYSLIIGGALLAVLIVIRIRKIIAAVTEIIHQTLKDREGKWSLPRIMMVAAFNACIAAFFYDMYKQGHMNEIAFVALLTVAVTGKIADAQAKKIDPTIVAPKDVE